MNNWLMGALLALGIICMIQKTGKGIADWFRRTEEEWAILGSVVAILSLACLVGAIITGIVLRTARVTEACVRSSRVPAIEKQLVALDARLIFLEHYATPHDHKHRSIGALEKRVRAIENPKEEYHEWFVPPSWDGYITNGWILPEGLAVTNYYILPESLFMATNITTTNIHYLPITNAVSL